ncbi:MAG: glycosyltransferase [Candidatus Omnitrophota bacterium]
MNVLGIGLDYLMLQGDKVRGDVRARQIEYARMIGRFDLIVYSPKESDLRPTQLAENLKVIPTNSKNKSSFIIDAWKAASDICRRGKIDVITVEDPFTTGLAGYLLKRRFRIPLNIQVHIDFCDNDYWIRQRRINWFFNKLAKFLLKRADTIRVGTTKEKSNLAAALGISGNRVFVIPVNCDLSKFTARDGRVIREKYLKGKFSKMVLFTGRLVPQKDITTLLRAFQIVMKEAPDTLLLIIGSGAEEYKLKKEVETRGMKGNVFFAGSVPHDEIPEYLAACDVYAVSSIFEGTCIAMVEAMASGKPVVVTRFAGTEDLIIDGKTGFVVEQKDHGNMAKRILDVLADPQLSRVMGEEGRQRVGKMFAGNRNVQSVIDLWKLTASFGKHG